MEMVCKNCGTVGEPERVTKGSLLIEIVLWCAFLVPGLIYSLWRLGSRHDACQACGSTELVPLSSPLGRKVAHESGYVAPAPYKGSQAAENFGRRVGRLFAKKK